MGMKRRVFIASLGCAAAVWPVIARAQQSVPIIAILGSGAEDAPSSVAQMQMLGAAMRDLGLVQGRDYVFEARWAGSDASRFPALATELMALHPKVFFVGTNLAVTSVQKLSRTVAIVDSNLNAPVATGLVESLSRPGGNVTGVSTMADDLFFKAIEIMREILPNVRVITAMLNPTNSSHPLMFDMLMRHFAGTQVSIGSVSVRSPADLDSAFAEVARQHPGALFVLTDNSLQGLAEPVVKRAMSQHLPVFGSFTFGFPQAGALFSYGRDSNEAFRAAARLLKKILDGAHPEDLPVEQPTKYTLIINLKSAASLGIPIPPTMLARADEVIE
jgi:putative tryptophan/tyrosine transport system substrate-binding protein